VAWALCVLPLGALADQPVQQVDRFSNTAGSAESPEPAPAGAPDGLMRGGHHRPTDDEWQDASSLLNRYSPKRMALVSALPDGPVKQRLRNFIYGRYLALLRVQDSFPQIFQLQLQRLTIEDNLFDLHRQYAAATGPAKASLHSELRQQVQALFDNVQQDRQARINRMKMLAVELQTKKDAAEQNRDTLIEEQLRDVIQYGPRVLDRERFLRRNGGVGGAENGGGASTSAPLSGGSEAQPLHQFQPTTNPD